MIINAVTRVKLHNDFAVKGDGGVHGIGDDIVITLRARIVGVEQEVVEVTEFAAEQRQFIATGARTITVLPLAANLEAWK